MGGKMLSGFFCKVCKFITDNVEDLNTHKVKCQIPDNLVKYNCDKCKFETKGNEILNKHIENTHNTPKLHPCERCAKHFITEILLEEHIEKEHNKKSFPCNLCTFVTENKDNLEAHKSYVHDQTIEYNNGKDDTEEIVKLKEQRNPQEINEHRKCDLCSFMALNDSDLRHHKQTLHDSQSLILRALKELTTRIGVLTNDVFNLKVNSIIIERDVYQVIKNEIVEEVNKHVTDKLCKVEEKLNTVTSVLDKLNDIAKNNIETNRKSEEIKKPEVMIPKQKKKTYKDAVTDSMKSQHEMKDKITSDPNQGKKAVTWFGTSISKVLNIKKFKEDTKADLKVVKAYCIQEEGLFPKSNFCSIVPAELEKQKADVAVFQTGSIEITNLDIKKAMMDDQIDIKDYEIEWFRKVEDDSTNLFNLAIDVTAKQQDLEVVILKRLPRFDPISEDPIGIKKKLSTFANNVYNQLWAKHGSPKNIKIKSLQLGISSSEYLKKIVMGNPGSPIYDGIHLLGQHAPHHFTYRAVQEIAPILKDSFRATYVKTGTFNLPNYHAQCPQAQYQQRQSSRNHSQSKVPQTSQSEQSNYQYGSHFYSVPVQNRFSENF